MGPSASAPEGRRRGVLALVLLGAVVAVVVVVLALTGRGTPADDAAGSPSPTASATAGVDPTAGPSDPPADADEPGWYLQLGDSLAAGYQPETGDDLEGGYADEVLVAREAEAPGTELRNLACSGETVVSLVDGGRCDYVHGSQLAEALAFLGERGAQTGLITVSIGANDLLACLPALEDACVAGGLAAVTDRLPEVLTALREAAPDADIAVLTYYNPVLASWLLGADGQVLAERSVAFHSAVNDAIRAAAGPAGAVVVEVEEAFATAETDLVDDPRFGAIPANVARVCELTWMCTRADIHPNDAGYDVLGEQIVAALRQ